MGDADKAISAKILEFISAPGAAASTRSEERRSSVSSGGAQ